MFTLAGEKTYRNGETIIREGSSGDWVYVVLSGSVEITKTIKGRIYKLGMLKKDDIFGELSFLGGIERTVTATAEGETVVGIIDREPLDIEFNRLSRDFRALIRNTAKRYRHFADTLCEVVPEKEKPALRSLSLTYSDRQSFVRAFHSGNGTGTLHIRTANPLRKEERILLKLSLPGISDPLRIIGQVTWAREKAESSDVLPPGMGIRLCEMSKNDNHTFKRFIEGAIGN